MSAPIVVRTHRHDDDITSQWSYLVYDVAGAADFSVGPVVAGEGGATGTVTMSGAIDAVFSVALGAAGAPGRISAVAIGSGADVRVEMTGVDVRFGKVRKAMNAIHDRSVADGRPDFDVDMPAIMAPFARRGFDVTGTGAWFEELAGGMGDDVVRGRGGEDVILGTPGADVIAGGAGDDDFVDYCLLDAILGPRGDGPGLTVDLAKGFARLPDGARQTLRGIEGGRGLDADDVLKGDDGGNDLVGGNGDDRVVGRGGDDALEGGGGEDTLVGGGGDDFLFGGDDADRVRGQRGGDDINGGAGDDLLFGNAGGDDIVGRDGDDTIKGGAGADRLRGGDGDDRLEGGPGDDTLEGDAGDDDLAGGAGADEFVLRVGGVDAGTDAVLDFDPGADRIRLPFPLGFGSLEFAQAGGDVEISVVGGGGEVIARIVGATVAEIDDAGLFVS